MLPGGRGPTTSCSENSFRFLEIDQAQATAITRRMIRMVAKQMLDPGGQSARDFDWDRQVVALFRAQPSEYPAQVHAAAPAIGGPIFPRRMNYVAAVEKHRTRRHDGLCDFMRGRRTHRVAPSVAARRDLGRSGFNIEVAQGEHAAHGHFLRWPRKVRPVG